MEHCLSLCLNNFFRGLQGGNSVLQMMHVAHVLDSDKTKFALLRGLVIRGDEHEFRVSLQKNTLVLQEPQLTTLLWDLALSGTHMWLPEVCSIFNQKDI